ncbi:hypothetical protein KR215_010083 [Drosophila sulfurigaster]|nr:hypothetical protein KR215_010083 [Drosophila sulfurigaster]
MKRLDIYSAFVALGGPGTKEDIIIQVAKQQNIRFNDLPQLQKEVDQALEESQRLGFIDRQGTIYKLNMETTPAKCSNSAPNKPATTKASQGTATAAVERISRQLNGQGDGKRSHSVASTRSGPKSPPLSLCSACVVDPNVKTERRKSSNNLDKILLPKDTSVCSICGLNSDNSGNTEEPDVDKSVWPTMRALI